MLAETPEILMPGPVGQESAAFDLLKSELGEELWQVPAPIYMWTVFVSHCLLAFAPLLLSFYVSSLWAKAACLFISAWGFVGISTQCHTASHNALSSVKSINRGITFFGYAFVLGLSANYWWRHHIGDHHKEPNLIGVDADIELGPLFAVTDDIVRRASPALRVYYSLQWLILPVVIALNAYSIQLRGLRFLYGQCAGHKRTVKNKNLVIDMCLLVLHYSSWLIIPSFFFPFTSVLSVYLMVFSMIGYGLFCTFAPCHFPEEAACIDANSKRTKDFLLRQSAATVNFRTGKIGQYLCGGLDYQIEHHLFPNIHPRYLRQLSTLVQPFCVKHRYPYRSWGWGQAIWKSMQVFYRPKPVEPALKKVGAR